MDITILLTQIESSSSSSDDDEDQDILIATATMINKRHKRKRHRQKGYVQKIVNQFRVDEFKTFFRMSRISMNRLQELISETCLEENVSGILDRESSGGTKQKPIKDRILMLLWLMASKDKYASIADRFGVSESTACVAIRNLLQFIAEYLLDKIIVWPTVHEQQEMQDMYFELKNFPGVVGMVDGSHIPIRRPDKRGIDYYNRKDFYSVVLQGTVREDMSFTHIYTGFPGKVHDARVFKHSDLYRNGPNMCRNGHILGDSAYPNLSFLLTPFKDNGHLTPSQKKFNKTHASIRSCVERSFGLLKGRFCRLQYIDQRDIKTIIFTIVTGCILHNICIKGNDEFADIFEQEEPVQPYPEEDFDVNQRDIGLRKRLQIARRL